MKPPRVEIGFRFDAVPLRTSPTTWAAQFHAPGHGVQFVRDDAGAYVRYRTAESAKAAALDAMMRAINGRARSRVKGEPMRVRSRSRGLVLFA